MALGSLKNIIKKMFMTHNKPTFPRLEDWLVDPGTVHKLRLPRDTEHIRRYSSVVRHSEIITYQI